MLEASGFGKKSNLGVNPELKGVRHTADYPPRLTLRDVSWATPMLWGLAASFHQP